MHAAKEAFISASSCITYGRSKVDDIADSTFRIKVNAVINLPVEDQLTGLAAIQCICLVDAFQVHQMRKLVDSTARNPVVFKAYGHIEIMPFPALGNPCAGVFLIDFSERIPVSLLLFPVFHKHRAKGDGIQDVMVLNIALHILPRALFAHIHEVEVAGAVNQQSVNGVVLIVAAGVDPLVETVQLPVVDSNAEIALEIKIGIDGSDRVRLRCKLGGIGFYRRTVGVLRELSAHLGGVRHDNLKAGADAVFQNFLPADGEERFVQIIQHGGSGNEVSMFIEDHALIFTDKQ